MNYNLQVIRIIATLIVVFGHSIIVYTPEWNTYSTPYNSSLLCGIKNLINLFQMELFFSVSGFCFFYAKKKQITIFSFIKNKVKRILVPFIIVGILYMIPIRILADYQYWNNISLLRIVYSVLTIKDAGHLWFLPVLFLIFVMSILVLKIKSNIIFFIFFITSFIMYYYSGIFATLIIKLTFHYLLFFLLGYYFNMYGIGENKKFSIYTLVFITLSIMLLLIIGLHNNIIADLLISTTIVMLFYVIEWPKFNKKIIDFLDKNSFGIYLFHSPIIYLVLNNFSELPPFLLVSANLFFSISLSLLFIFILRKLKFYFIIGE